MKRREFMKAVAAGSAAPVASTFSQCSENGRDFFDPRVGGGQLGNGAMGNARWRGVRLKDILDRAGVQAGARQVVFNALDRPVLPETSDFLKAPWPLTTLATARSWSPMK